MSLQSRCNTILNCRRNWAVSDQNWLVSDQNWRRAETDKPVFINQINKFCIISVSRNESAETAAETNFSVVKARTYGSLAVSVFRHPLRGRGGRLRLRGAPPP